MSVPKPTNRMILVNLVEEEQEENGILLPEDYKTPNRHLVGEVVAKAEDCTLPASLGDRIVFQTSVLEQVKAFGKDHNFVSENYVVCVL